MTFKTAIQSIIGGVILAFILLILAKYVDVLRVEHPNLKTGTYWYARSNSAGAYVITGAILAYYLMYLFAYVVRRILTAYSDTLAFFVFNCMTMLFFGFAMLGLWLNDEYARLFICSSIFLSGTYAAYRILIQKQTSIGKNLFIEMDFWK